MHLATVASASQQEQPPSHQAQAQPRLLRRRATQGGTVVGSPPNRQHHFQRRTSSTGVKHASYGVGHQRTVLGSPPRQATQVQNGTAEYGAMQNQKKGNTTSTHKDRPPGSQVAADEACVTSPWEHSGPNARRVACPHRGNARTASPTAVVRFPVTKSGNSSGPCFIGGKTQ